MSTASKTQITLNDIQLANACNLSASNSHSMGQPLGALPISNGRNLSKTSVHHMQYWYAAGIALAVAIIGGFCGSMKLEAWHFKLIFLAVFVLAGILAKICLHIRTNKFSKIEVFENGVRLSAPFILGDEPGAFAWEDVESHHNRVMIQPASRLVNDSMLRCTIVYRLKSDGVARRSRELQILVKRHELKLAKYVAVMMGCQQDEWAGYATY